MKNVRSLLERVVSLLMAAGLGYGVLSQLDSTTAFAVAGAMVVLGAIAKAALFAGAKRARTPA